MSVSQAVRFVSVSMLVMALFEMPAAYYSALRFVVTIAAIMEVFHIRKGVFSEGKKTTWTLAFAAIAIVFNPLLPLEMDREIWMAINIASAFFFLVASLNKRAAKAVGIATTTALVLYGAGYASNAIYTYSKHEEKIKNWRLEAEKSKFNRFRLAYNNPEYAAWVMQRALKEAPFPEFAMRSGLNMAFVSWLLKKSVTSSEVDDFKKSLYGRQLTEANFYEDIKYSINTSDGRRLSLGGRDFILSE